MFKTHKLTEKGFQEMKEFKGSIGAVVMKALESMPEGREKSVFKTKIEEAMFFGAKAIAEKADNHSEVTDYLAEGGK